VQSTPKSERSTSVFSFFPFVGAHFRAPSLRLARIPTPSFRTQQADFFLPIRSCESGGLRERNLPSLCPQSAPRAPRPRKNSPFHNRAVRHIHRRAKSA
jgi:hypothetical protein